MPDNDLPQPAAEMIQRLAQAQVKTFIEVAQNSGFPDYISAYVVLAASFEAYLAFVLATKKNFVKPGQNATAIQQIARLIMESGVSVKAVEQRIAVVESKKAPKH